MDFDSQPTQPSTTPAKKAKRARRRNARAMAGWTAIDAANNGQGVITEVQNDPMEEDGVLIASAGTSTQDLKARLVDEARAAAQSSQTVQELRKTTDKLHEENQRMVEKIKEITAARKAGLSTKPLKSQQTQKPRDNRFRTFNNPVAPSQGSGGIPNPSGEYHYQCTFSPRALDQPQHLLLVIDLNGTLLYRPNKKDPKKFNMRPHAQTFLQYCVDTFAVVIWSSARPENVNAMCATIMTPDIKQKVAAIWGRDKFGLTQNDYDQRTQCYKRLTKIWQDPYIKERHPGIHLGHTWDQTNTVLIDDSREKARSEPHNLIEVPEYLGDPKERDDILPQVHDYLNHLSMHSNVSACLASHPWKPVVYGTDQNVNANNANLQ